MLRAACWSCSARRCFASCCFARGRRSCRVREQILRRVAERFAVARIEGRRQQRRFAEWERQELRTMKQQELQMGEQWLLRAEPDSAPALADGTINPERPPQKRAGCRLQ